jgi:hypothetical protein
MPTIDQSVEKVQATNQPAAQSSGYFDAFLGLADTYVNARFNESSRESYTNRNEALGNTEALYQPTTGQTSAGETIVASQKDTDLNKVAVYSAIGLGAVLTFGVIYKVIK